MWVKRTPHHEEEHPKEKLIHAGETLHDLDVSTIEHLLYRQVNVGDLDKPEESGDKQANFYQMRLTIAKKIDRLIARENKRERER